MSKHNSGSRGCLLLFSLLAVFSFCRPSPAAESLAQTDKDRIVVMMSIDGLAAYYMDDPKAGMKTLQALAAQGARATMMKASAPTVTWPNHTTLVTGVNPAIHGVVGNNYLNRTNGQKVILISDPTFDKDQIVKVPTIYDLAHDDGLKTVSIRWPATRNAKTLDWTMPDVATTELIEKYTTPSVYSEAEKMGVPLGGKAGSGNEGSSASPRDDLYTKLFDQLVHEHRPGLALLHVAAVDHNEHLYGPRSPKAYEYVKAADHQVKEVWDELQRDFPGKATLIVVSDHGFSPVKKQILPNILLKKAGLENPLVGGEGKDVQVVIQGGAVFIYVRDEAHRAALLERARRAFDGVEGVEKVIGTSDFPAYGVADPKDDPHAPDLIAFANLGYSFGDTANGELPFNEKPERKGSHGHNPNIPELHATFVAWGDGIKKGANLGEISNTSVAPTIAKLLGIKMPDNVAAPLMEALLH